LEVLLPKVNDTNTHVASCVLSALGELSIAGGLVVYHSIILKFLLLSQ
jgi:hypothetical protein